MPARTKDTVRIKTKKKKPSVRVQTTKELQLKQRREAQQKPRNIPENTREVRRIVNGKVQVSLRPTTYKKKDKSTTKTSKKKLQVHTIEELLEMSKKQLYDRGRYVQRMLGVDNETIKRHYARKRYSDSWLDWNSTKISQEARARRIHAMELALSEGGYDTHRYLGYIRGTYTGLRKQSSIAARLLLLTFDSLSHQAQIRLMGYMERDNQPLLKAWLELVNTNYTGEGVTDELYYDLINYINEWLSQEITKGEDKMEDLVNITAWFNSLIEEAEENKYGVSEKGLMYRYYDTTTGEEWYVPKFFATEDDAINYINSGKAEEEVKRYATKGIVVESLGYVDIDVLKFLRDKDLENN